MYTSKLKELSTGLKVCYHWLHYQNLSSVCFRAVCVCQSLSCVQLFATPWTVAGQAPLPMDFPGKNTGVGSHSFLQGICLTQRSNPGLLHYRQILYYLSHQASLNGNHPLYKPRKQASVVTILYTNQESNSCLCKGHDFVPFLVSNIPLYICTTSSLSIPLSMDIYAVSMSWLL